MYARKSCRKSVLKAGGLKVAGSLQEVNQFFVEGRKGA